MTREEARKAAEVMLAYADGKKVEIRNLDDTWSEIDIPVFDWLNSSYRIKPEPKYRPFKDAEECWQEMQKHQPFGWIKEKRSCVTACIETLYNFGFYIERRDTILKFPEALKICSFADGEPFGVKKV